MRDWALKWQEKKPAHRAMVLIGSPGIGKTSAAEALAADMGWAIVEMNASDQRNAQAIKDIALRASMYSSFGEDGSFLSAAEGKMKLIVLDEADCLYGNADRGAMPVISELVKTSSQPVILIANDGYALNKKSSVIKEKTLQITFRRPTAASIGKVVRKVCAAEGVAIDDDAVAKLSENAAGDIRAALRDLQSLAAAHPHITYEHAAALSGREERSEMFDVVSAIYRRRDPELARKVLMQADTDPDTMLLWLSENMPYECHTSGDLVRVSERLSRADIYLGRVRKRMQYGFYSYATDMMVHGVPEAIRSNEVTRDRIRFPMYLMRMSRSKGARALRASTAAKVAAYMHTSSTRVINDVLPQLRVMMLGDPDMRQLFAKKVELEPEEFAFILGVAPDRAIVKEAYAEEKPAKVPKKTKKKAEPEPTMQVPKKKAGEAPPAPPEPAAPAAPAPEPPPAPQPEAPAEPEEPPREAPKEAKKQKSLFDFGA